MQTNPDAVRAAMAKRSIRELRGIAASSDGTYTTPAAIEAAARELGVAAG